MKKGASLTSSTVGVKYNENCGYNETRHNKLWLTVAGTRNANND